MDIEQDKPSAFKKTYDQLNEKNKVDFPQNKHQFVENLSKIISNFMTPFIKSVAKQERKTMRQLGIQMTQQQQAAQSTPPRQKYSLPIPTAFGEEEKKANDCKSNDKKTNSKKQPTQVLSQQLSKTKIIKKSQKQDMKDQSQTENNKTQNYEIKNNRIYLKGMPKKPVSSFFFFYKYYSRLLNGTTINANGQKQCQPGPYGSQLAKKISQKWKLMTQEEKQPFAKMAQETKDKYKVDMQNFKQLNKSSFMKIKKKRLQRARYLRKLKKNREEGIQEPLQVKPVPPLIRPAEKNKKTQYKQIPKNIQGKNQKSQSHHSSHSGSHQKKKNFPKKIKNQHKPRAPVPSFFFYYKVIKEEIAIQHNIKIGSEIAKIASSKWKLMTQQQKQPYQIQARQRRKQYHDQMIIFRQKYPEEAQKMKRQKVQMMEEKKTKKREKQQAQKQDSIVNSQSQDHENSSQQVDSLQGQVTKAKTNKNQDRKKAQRQKQIVKEKQRTHEQKKSSQSSYDLTGKSHRPKAPISSFFMFFKENNVLLAEQFKQSFGAKLVKYASQIWRNMSVQQKRPYQEKSQVTRDQYYQAMNQYKRNYPQEIKQRKIQLKKMKLQKTKNPPAKTIQKSAIFKKQESNSQEKEQIQNSQSIRQNQSSL